QEYNPELKARKQADKLAQAKKELEQQLNESLPAELRHIEYTRLLNELDLHPDDKADLLARGFTESQIVLSGFKSVTRYQSVTGEYHASLPGINQKSNQIIAGESGYIIPVKNYDGLITGLQLRLRNPVETGRYRWISGKETVLKVAIPVNGLEPVLENPLAIFKPVNQPKAIWIVEGTGAKPFLTSQRLNAFVIGAAGGQFLASQNQFETAINRAIADYGQLPIRIALDAGDIENTSVRNRWVEIARHLQKLNYDFSFVWYNQFLKTDSDIDELSSTELEKIEFISFEQFLNIKSNEIVFKSSKAFNEKAFQEWDISRKFTATHKLNQKHFQINDDIPKSGAIVAGKAFMGSGKTHSQLITIKANNQNGVYSYILSPRRKLNKQTIERAKKNELTIYNLKDDNGLELLPGKETN
ncbi:MAG: DEAD/DEAH box helicase family protein, partial [Nostoc sp.]